MKVIKLFLLLTFGLWADFKLDVPNDVNTSLLKNIVKNGWNESNVTLNNFIISNAERVMPEILEKINKPFQKEESTKEDSFPVLKINLGSEDYEFIVAYTKYLEFNDNIDKSLELNIQILKGFKNIEDKSMLSVVYSLVVEQTVREGLTQLLSTDKDLKNNSMLSKRLPNLFVLETSAFFRAMEEEKKYLLDAWDESAYQESVMKEYTINNQYFMEDITKKIKIYNDNLYKRIFTAMRRATPEGMKIFEDKIKLERKQTMGVVSNIRMIFSSFLIKIKSLLGMKIRDFGYVSERIALQLVYVARVKLSVTYLDYLKHIEKNKKFLTELERINKPF